VRKMLGRGPKDHEKLPGGQTNPSLLTGKKDLNGGAIYAPWWQSIVRKESGEKKKEGERRLGVRR